MDLFSPMLVTKAVVTRSGATCHKSPVRPSCNQTRNDERSCPDNIHRTSQLLTAGYCLPKHLNGKGETIRWKARIFPGILIVFGQQHVAVVVFASSRSAPAASICIWMPPLSPLSTPCPGAAVRPCVCVCIVTAAPGDSQPGPGPANGGGFN